MDVAVSAMVAPGVGAADVFVGAGVAVGALVGASVAAVVDVACAWVGAGVEVGLGFDVAVNTGVRVATFGTYNFCPA